MGNHHGKLVAGRPVNGGSALIEERTRLKWSGSRRRGRADVPTAPATIAARIGFASAAA